jgi:hypothetical protein
MHGSAKAEPPIPHGVEPSAGSAKPAVESTGQQETGATSKPPTAASMSYENLSDSDEDEGSEAGAPDAERSGGRGDRFDSTTPPMFYSFLTMPTRSDDGGGSTPRSRLTSVTSLSHMSRCAELPKAERVTPVPIHTTAPHEQGARAAPPPQCLYEPLSDDENE